MQNDTNQTYTPDGPAPFAVPRKPNLSLPKGSCDTHCHIFGPFNRYPLPTDRSFNPNEAPETALRRLHEYLGVDHAVIVQSQGHGLDHQPMLDALKAGQGRYRGIALVRPDAKPATLREYDEAGVRGVRFSFMPHLGMPNLDDVRAVISLVRPMGWHICIHVAGTGLLAMSDFIKSIEPTVIIDHMARPDLVQNGTNNPAVMELLRLVDTGRIWVKLSGPERLSKQTAPYRDVVPIAKELLERAPERTLWGSDWPHVNLHGPMPDDGNLVDFIGEYAAGDKLHKLLVESPQGLYGFTGP